MFIRRTTRACVVALLCAAAGSAAAAPRIAIGGVRNDPDGAVAAALAKAVCGQLECVDAALVQVGKRIDFATARRNRVDAVLYGTVVQRGATRSLALALLRDSFKPVKTWSLPVHARGRVSGGTVAADLAALLEPAGGPAGGTEPAPVEAPMVEGVPPPAPAPSPPAPAPPPPPPSDRVPAAAEPEVRRAPRPAPRPGRTTEPAVRAAAPAVATFASVEIGVGALQRRLAYQGLGPSAGTLRDFRGGTLVVPSARAQAFPLASAEGAWYAGLGVFAGYARSVGFQTEDAVAGRSFDSVYSALDAGVAYRLSPLGRIGLRLVPAVWYRTLSFEVKPSGGVTLRGLPDAALAGVAAGIAIELPVVRRVSILADASFTVWTTAKDLVGDTYFASGSAKAADAGAGASIALAGPLSLRVLATFGQTWYSLSGSSAFVATGATDRYLGIRSAIHARY